MQTKLYNPLLFCGMGCTGTGGEVRNCRLRTILRNDDGRDIFIEIVQGMNDKGVVTDIFYNDSDWDRNRGISTELTWLFHVDFEYTKDGIINFINKNLNCSFSGIELTNTHPDNVICSSSYKKSDYKDTKININVLDGIVPLKSHKNIRKYSIGYKTVLEFMGDYIEKQDDYKKEKYPEYKYFTILRFEDDGTIYGMDISSNNDFCCMSFGSDDMIKMICIIKNEEMK